jgi:hypothetical protein
VFHPWATFPNALAYDVDAASSTASSRVGASPIRGDARDERVAMCPEARVVRPH